MRLTTQVNLPKMNEGGMDVSFMIVYVGQGPLTPEGYDRAYKQAIAKFDAVHRLTEKIAPDKIGLALTPDDVVSASKRASRGRRHRRRERLSDRHRHQSRERILRSRRPLHVARAQRPQSARGLEHRRAAKAICYNNGLSPLGAQVIAEMNRLGIMVDVSHPSKGAIMQAIGLSKAPVIASHSGSSRARQRQPQYGR